MATVAILGASGYAGQEALDRVLGHPELEVVALGSDSLAGETAAALDVRLNGSLPRFVRNDEAAAAGADLLLLCLGHDRAAAFEPPAGAVVVDLSGAHRLHDTSLYARWYGWEHPAEAVSDGGQAAVAQPVNREAASGGLARAGNDGWSYAIPELFPPSGRLIANPGCYATAALLGLAPLREAIDTASVVVDAKSGVSGAGRELKASSHAGFVLENVSPYKVGAHQHAPEIEQALGFPVCFVPHLLPVRRGLLATCYVTPTAELRPLLEAAYADSDVVRVLPEGVAPELARVQHTDGAEIALFADRATERAVVICALDNLGKGAAGQAIQNANLALGLDETAGLRLAGVLV